MAAFTSTVTMSSTPSAASSQPHSTHPNSASVLPLSRQQEVPVYARDWALVASMNEEAEIAKQRSHKGQISLLEKHEVLMHLSYEVAEFAARSADQAQRACVGQASFNDIHKERGFRDDEVEELRAYHARKRKVKEANTSRARDRLSSQSSCQGR
ncbi:hypothetical protein DENSPDRAFT_842153 [Dentipellis sp. KUC8613]|nr:hypothetical protein DENSPDRAFT_842153 [Dentipellis sp. KUC8613]